MPKLIVYVPFSASPHLPSDVRKNANDMVGTTDGGGLTIRGSQITNIVGVYSGDEARTDNRVTTGDVICVHAHGGPGDSDMTDNHGEETLMEEVFTNLEIMGASDAASIYFFVCFSAQEGHIAHKWKRDNPGQRVFGNSGIAQGAIGTTMRSGRIRSSIFDATNRQLEEL